MEMHQLRILWQWLALALSVEPRANAVLPGRRSASRSKSWNPRLAIDSSSGLGAERFSLPLVRSFLPHALSMSKMPANLRGIYQWRKRDPSQSSMHA
jgi:hypothetical protein